MAARSKAIQKKTRERKERNRASLTGRPTIHFDNIERYTI